MVKRKLNLKKAALVSLTAAVVFSGLGVQKANADQKANKPEVKTVTEDEVFDDLLTAVDGYSSQKKYDKILKTEEKEEKVETEPIVETEPVIETPKEETVTEAPKEEPAPEETETENNAYVQYNDNGDAYAVIGENGDLVETPEVSETSSEEETEVKTGTPASEVVSEEASAAVHNYFNNFENNDAIAFINNNDLVGFAAELKNKLKEGLDFLFFDGKIEGYSKSQVNNETISLLVNSLRTYCDNLAVYAPGWEGEMAQKYIEAKEFLQEEMIDKFTELGQEIAKNNPEEETLSEEQTMTR